MRKEKTRKIANDNAKLRERAKIRLLICLLRVSEFTSYELASWKLTSYELMSWELAGYELTS